MSLRLLKITLLLAGIALPVFGSVVAGGHKATKPAKVAAVLELYTSQGCSSCPPADKLLRSYVERPDVMALTLPVDYWDYIGWKDTFAKPQMGERQRSYARARGDGRVYTPQVVVNGIEHAVGSNRVAIDRAIEATAKRFEQSQPPMRVWWEENSIVIEIGAAADGAQIRDANIWLATVQNEGTVDIKRGENRGRKVTYYNIVRNMTPVGMWNGTAMTVRMPRDIMMQPGIDRCAVLVQDGKAGPLIAAAWMKE